MFCMQNRVLPVERASFPICMPIFTAWIAHPRPGRAAGGIRLLYEATASTDDTAQFSMLFNLSHAGRALVARPLLWDTEGARRQRRRR